MVRTDENYLNIFLLEITFSSLIVSETVFPVLLTSIQKQQDDFVRTDNVNEVIFFVISYIVI